MAKRSTSPARKRTAPRSNGALTLDELTAENVEAVVDMERAEHENRTPGDRAADAITAFCGSMWFVWTHVVWFVGWIVVNVIPRLAFDPFPFSFLTLVVSLEAIFLSTFILISENRQAKLMDRRNHLDLQIDLLAEQENTKQLMLMKRIAEKIGVELDDDEVAALEEPTRYDQLAEQIERSEKEATEGPRRRAGRRVRH